MATVSKTQTIEKFKSNPRFKDLTNQRFGKLIVIEPTDKRADNGSVVWLCRCDCGNLAEVSSKRLLTGKVKSCGCLSKPPQKTLEGEKFGRLTVEKYLCKIRKNKSTQVYWKCICDCGNETIVTQSELLSGGTLSCGCLQKERSCNVLELIDDTSVAILERNKTIMRKSNTSGHTGVSLTKDGRWVAYINFKKKRYHLGRFDNKEDAIAAREQGEKMHDDFLNWYHSNCCQKKDAVLAI